MEAAFAPPGQLVDVGGYCLHLLCEGEGGPTVILESGMPGVPLGWSRIQPEVARFTRICSYDRAGIGWSDAGPGPRTGRQVVRELHTLLQRAQEEPPYVLVASSFGGHYIRLYASQYPEEVVGLVFVDCSHEDMVANFPPPMRRAFSLSRYVIGAFAVLARLGITCRMGARLPIVSQLLQELRLPDEAQRQLLWHYGRPAQWNGMYAEATVSQQTEAEVRAARAEQPSLDDIPLVILTAQGTWSDPKQLVPGVKPGEVAPIWLRLQQDLASLSSRSTHRVFEQYTHAGLLGSGAEHVVAAIRQVVEATQERGPS
jgi:pimeloyl-ACP methyl ester carboxylesterase